MLYRELFFPAKNAKVFFILTLKLVTVARLRETKISNAMEKDQSQQKSRSDQGKRRFERGMTISLFLPCCFVLRAPI